MTSFYITSSTRRPAPTSWAPWCRSTSCPWSPWSRCRRRVCWCTWSGSASGDTSHTWPCSTTRTWHAGIIRLDNVIFRLKLWLSVLETKIPRLVARLINTMGRFIVVPINKTKAILKFQTNNSLALNKSESFNLKKCTM